MSSVTFCINTARNELDHIKLLFRSMEYNFSSKDHEILVFIDSDNQNTFEWLLTQKTIFPNLKIMRNELPICYGYARNINEMFKAATSDIVSYLQSDMVVCKNYDVEILKHLKPNTIICSTRIEPPLHGTQGEKITHDFGLDPVSFNLDSFTSYAENAKLDKLTAYFFAPFTMYKSVWNDIGGHDTVFRRSREDSDILTRLVLNDVCILQTWSALVYHFTCTSSRGLNWFDPTNNEAQERARLQQAADNIELGRFITKWGDFGHSLSKSKYYNVAAYIEGKDLSLADFSLIQSYFHVVFVEDVALIDLMQERYDRNQIIANRLLNISSEDWDEYGYMYNQFRAADRIKPISELGAEDVIVKFKLHEITAQTFHEFIERIQHIVDSVEETGDYEYGPFKITVNQKLDRAKDKIKVTNPEVKVQHLYKIY